jgi:crossover junction endodeoxyribonuclease RuvC
MGDPDTVEAAHLFFRDANPEKPNTPRGAESVRGKSALMSVIAKTIAPASKTVHLDPRVLGIDPGTTGGIALLDGTVVSVWDIPVVDGSVNVPEAQRIIRNAAPDMAVIEMASARPGQGVSSMFRYGQAYGALLAVIACTEIPHHLVTPTTWKRAYHLSSDKETSRALAIRTWPAQADLFRWKTKHGLAEACLIALYGRDFMWRRS